MDATPTQPVPGIGSPALHCSPGARSFLERRRRLSVCFVHIKYELFWCCVCVWVCVHLWPGWLPSWSRCCWWSTEWWNVLVKPNGWAAHQLLLTGSEALAKKKLLTAAEADRSGRVVFAGLHYGRLWWMLRCTFFVPLTFISTSWFLMWNCFVEGINGLLVKTSNEHWRIPNLKTKQQLWWFDNGDINSHEPLLLPDVNKLHLIFFFFLLINRIIIFWMSSYLRSDLSIILKSFLSCSFYCFAVGFAVRMHGFDWLSSIMRDDL